MTSAVGGFAKRFANGFDPFRPWAFWFWNGDMRPQEITRQLVLMKEQAIHEFLIHPMLGLEIGYLSDEYFAAIEYTCGVANEMGMGIWIYDEFGWPSGVASGKVIAGRPDLMCRHLRYARVAASQGHHTFTRMNEDLVAAFALTGQGSLDLSGFIIDNTLRAELPSDTTEVLLFTIGFNRRLTDNTVGAPWAPEVPGYVDNLNPRAVAEFMALTHEAYKARVGRYFGNAIKGFFTDEPSVNGQSAPECLPYTPGLCDRFSAEYGYDLMGHLPELVEPKGDHRVKADYRRLIGLLFEEAYHKPMREWCEANNLMYTGHVMEHDLSCNIHESGEILGSLRHMHWPGIDHLFTGRTLADGNPFTVKLVQGISDHIGAERFPCETGGVADWQTSLAEYLATCHWLCALGVNCIGIMGFMYSMKGVRPETYSPAYGYQSPMWPYTRLLSDRLGRLCLFSAEGEHRPHAAILYPSRALQTASFGPDHRFKELEDRVQGYLHGLLSAQCDVVLAWEEMLVQAQVKEGRLQAGGLTADLLVVPEGTGVEGPTAELLQRLKSQGLAVVYADPTEPGALASAIMGIRNLDVLENGVLANDIIVQRRYSSGLGTLYMLYNATDGNRSLEPRGAGCYTLWDPGTGGSCPVAKTLELPPYGLVCLSQDEMDVQTPQAAQVAQEQRGIVELSAQWGFKALCPNTYPLRGWEFASPTGSWHRSNGDSVPSHLKDYGVLRARNRFELGFMPGDLHLVFPGSHIRELKINGTTVDLSSAVPHASDESARAISLNGLVVVGMNGIEVLYSPPTWERHVHNDNWFGLFPAKARLRVFLEGSFEVCGEVLDGEPRVIFGRSQRRARELSVRGRLVPLNTMADMGPKVAGGLVGRGSWTGFGYPYYSGSGSYHARVLLPEAPGAIVVAPMDGVVELHVNGIHLCTKAWEPYEFGIPSEYLGTEVDLGITVTNTIRNRLEDPWPSGLEGVWWKA